MQSARHQLGPSHTIVRPPWFARLRRTLYMTILWMSDTFLYVVTYRHISIWKMGEKTGAGSVAVAVSIRDMWHCDRRHATLDMWHVKHRKPQEQLSITDVWLFCDQQTHIYFVTDKHIFYFVTDRHFKNWKAGAPVKYLWIIRLCTVDPVGARHIPKTWRRKNNN